MKTDQFCHKTPLQEGTPEQCQSHCRSHNTHDLSLHLRFTLFSESILPQQTPAKPELACSHKELHSSLGWLDSSPKTWRTTNTQVRVIMWTLIIMRPHFTHWKTWSCKNLYESVTWSCHRKERKWLLVTPGLVQSDQDLLRFSTWAELVSGTVDI